MRTPIFSKVIFGALGMAAVSGVSLGLALAHEAHGAKCSETMMNSMHADIQAMDDGDAKTKAVAEMELAHEMMDKKDTKGCEEHMHNAMEAIEE